MSRIIVLSPDSEAIVRELSQHPLGCEIQEYAYIDTAESSFWSYVPVSAIIMRLPSVLTEGGVEDWRKSRELLACVIGKAPCACIIEPKYRDQIRRTYPHQIRTEQLFVFVDGSYTIEELCERVADAVARRIMFTKTG